MFKHYENLGILVLVLCCSPFGCKPELAQQPGSDEKPAATAPDAENSPRFVAVPVEPSLPYPAATIVSHQGEFEISRGSRWQQVTKTEKHPETDLAPGDLLRALPESSTKIDMRRFGKFEVLAEAQVRMPEHAPCGIELLFGGISAEGPPVIKEQYNRCWIHTPTAAAVSGQGKALIHVAAGGQTFAHNVEGTLIFIDHDGAQQRVPPGQTALIYWDKTEISPSTKISSDPKSFLEAHPLDPTTIERILASGQNQQKRFADVFEETQSLSEKRRQLSAELTKRRKSGVTMRSAEDKMLIRQISSLALESQEKENQLLLIYHRMLSIIRLAGPAHTDSFEDYQALALKARTRLRHLFRFGPGMPIAPLKRPPAKP